MEPRNRVVIDYTNVLSDAVGDKHGITPPELAETNGRAGEVFNWLNDLTKAGTVGFFDLPEQDTKKIRKYAATVREKYQNLVVLGIGGSALGTTAVHNAVNHSCYNLLSKRKRNGYPRLFIADNIDPVWFAELLGTLDPAKTLFNVISKSGSTAETMSQFMIVFDLLKRKLKGKWKKKVLITTDHAKGVLREIVDENRLTAFEVPDNVGGRFSVLTPVGLVPLACAGVDIDALLAGAADMAERCRETDPAKNPAWMFAALHYLADVKKGMNMSVMMPYSTKLYGVADWYRQLWAESLGKKADRQGNTVHTGQTPIKALGATDQHSQVQLYVEGPHDKLVSFIEVEDQGKEVTIPEVLKDKAALEYLGGASLNHLLKTELKGTEYALTTHQRPNLTIKMPDTSAHSVGQLIFMLEAATAYAGGLYNIDPFDQPGVEFGKQYTYAMMGRAGFEDMKKELEQESGASRHTV